MNDDEAIALGIAIAAAVDVDTDVVAADAIAPVAVAVETAAVNEFAAEIAAAGAAQTQALTLPRRTYRK